MELGVEVSSFSALGSCRVSLGRVPLLRQWVWPKAKVLAGSSLWGLTGVTAPPSPFALHSFPELEHPRLSKVLRTAAFVYPFLYDNIPLFCRVSQGVPGQESGATTTGVTGCFQRWSQPVPHPSIHSFSSASGVTAPGMRLWPGTATTSSLHCSLASSSHPTCLSAWRPAASTTLVSSSPQYHSSSPPCLQRTPCSRSWARSPSTQG